MKSATSYGPNCVSVDRVGSARLDARRQRASIQTVPLNVQNTPPSKTRKRSEMSQLVAVIEAFPPFGQFAPGGRIARRAGALLAERGSRAKNPKQNAWQKIEQHCQVYKASKGRRLLFGTDANGNIGLLRPKEQIYALVGERPYEGDRTRHTGRPTTEAMELPKDIWTDVERDASRVPKAETNDRIRREIDRDLAPVLEGLAGERNVMLRSRAYGLAAAFVRTRQQEGKLLCDVCGFDPVSRAAGTGVKPRSLMDVHHRDPLAEGKRLTTVSDFALLCPTCHRFAHALIRASTARVTAG